MSKSRILLLIGLFLTLTMGSFVYYIVTWDPAERAPVSFNVPQILPPEAAPAIDTSDTSDTSDTA